MSFLWDGYANRLKGKNRQNKVTLVYLNVSVISDQWERALTKSTTPNMVSNLNKTATSTTLI
jgi:hypothetical protein